MAAAVAYELPTSVGKTRISPLAILVAGLLALCASAVATQVFAYRLGFHPSLGTPLAHGAPPFLRSIYVPWAWVRWAITYGNPLSKVEYGKPVHEALGTLPWTLGIGFALSIVGLVAAAALFERPSKVAEIVDSARWADRKDLEREGFFRAAGPIIGGFESRKGIEALRYDGQNGIEHTAVPGDDKTTQLKTNLLMPLQREKAERVATYGDTVAGRRADFWGEEPSFIALDVKALSDSTSGYQKSLGKDVLIFEPLAPSNQGRACYNPLWDIRIGTDHEPDDAYQAALDLTDADGKGLPTYWDNACTAFGAAVIATLGYRALQQQKPELLSLPSLVDYISSFRAQAARSGNASAKPPIRLRRLKMQSKCSLRTCCCRTTRICNLGGATCRGSRRRSGHGLRARRWPCRRKPPKSDPAFTEALSKNSASSEAPCYASISRRRRLRFASLQIGPSPRSFTSKFRRCSLINSGHSFAYSCDRRSGR